MDNHKKPPPLQWERSVTDIPREQYPWSRILSMAATTILGMQFRRHAWEPGRIIFSTWDRAENCLAWIEHDWATDTRKPYVLTEEDARAADWESGALTGKEIRALKKQHKIDTEGRA